MSKVLFIHGVSEIGGAERELLLMLEQLPKFGYSPVVVAPREGGLASEIARLGLSSRPVPLPAWRKWTSLGQRPMAVRQLRQVVIVEHPALVHVNDIWWVPQTLRALIGTGIPIAAHVRQEIAPMKVKRYELDRANLVFAVSRRIQESLAAGGVPRERLRVLYSGVDLRAVTAHDERALKRQLGLPGTARILGTVANLFPRKGYEIMLRALPIILASVPEAHYVVIGSGDVEYEAALRRMVSQLGLQGQVHFLGHQDSVYAYLAGLDLYVHPALMEGFGIAVLEAMAMRRAVVATHTGGVPEIVDDGVTGILVPSGDAEALAAGVITLLNDPARASTMSHAGWKRANECFSLDRMMTQLTSGYGALVQSVPVS